MTVDGVGDSARIARLVPAWYGGDLFTDEFRLSPKLRARLREWNRVWEVVLDPVTEVRWPDPEVGRAWILEGHRLVDALQTELGTTVQVEAGFAAYDPDGNLPPGS